MKVYAIPGLGTNEKLYSNTSISGFELKVLEWPITEKGDTIRTYAQKFAKQIDQSEAFCLLGVSFGGMICTELSKIVAAKKTVVVSTCKLRQEMPWFLKVFKHAPFHLMVSEKKHREMAYKGRWFIGLGDAYIPDYLGMVNSMNTNYFRNCITMIVNWDNQSIPSNIIHIHGTKDRLLKYKLVTANYTIENGSHAMIISRAEEINRILEKEFKASLQ